MVWGRPITERYIQRVLTAGFALVILLLVAAGFVGVVNVRSIRRSASSLVSEQIVTTRLIDEIQREQTALSAVFHRLARDPETIDRDRILRQLQAAGAAIHSTVAAAAGSPDEALWSDLDRAAVSFSEEARRFIDEQPEDREATRRLVLEHDAVFAIVAKLIAASYERASAAEARIEAHSNNLVRQSSVLLGACLLLALLSTILTVRTTSGLFRQMEWQASELSRVSWHMLDRQETVARRFSHELHDELGQAMTALKASLVALSPDSGTWTDRRDDCLRLVDESIANIRELSHLLRPTILDDFGLDAGLKWLAEGFMARTGIQVDYSCRGVARLPDETETHLFRIAQEALTNVARHSRAQRVAISLSARDHQIRLRIEDDGKGLPVTEAFPGGMGMIGMRARARSVGGELTVKKSNLGGVEINVELPLGDTQHASEDPHSVSR